MANKPARKNPFLIPPVDPRPRIYISGPVTGRENLNEAAFRDAADRLDDAGLHPVVPHDIIDPDASWLTAMAGALGLMCTVDGVAVLDGWDESTGAIIEMLAAQHQGMPLATVDDWVDAARNGGLK